MRVVAIYNFGGEDATPTEGFVREILRRHPMVEVVPIDTETRGGQEYAKLYDIMQYPAFLVTRDTGELVQLWQGDFPLIDELVGYAFA